MSRKPAKPETPPADPPPPSSDIPAGTEGIVDDITSHEPMVNPAVIQQMESQAAEADAIPSAERAEAQRREGITAPSMLNLTPQLPRSSEQFDPAIHEVNPDGTPRTTSDGAFRRKRGRKSGATVPGSGGSKPTDSIPKSVTFDYAGTAKFMAGLMFAACETALGPAWKPSDPEREAIEVNGARYCESKDWGDIPPGIALSLAFGMYALPRIGDPETRKRLTAYKGLIFKPKNKPLPSA